MSQNNAANPAAAAQQTVVNAQLKGIMEVVDGSFDALVANQPRARIPEPVFVHHFLPYFTGNGTGNPERNPMAEWIGVAGSATAQVDVINEGGEVLFTVPPMMDSNIINLNQVGGRRLNDLIVDYQLHGEGLPGSAARFYATEIQKKLQQIAPGHADETQATKQWRQIFTRYDVKTPGAEAEAAAKVEAEPDDLVY